MADSTPFVTRAKRVLTDPRRLVGAVLNRLRQIPFVFSPKSAFPGTYRAYIPERYWGHTKNEGPIPQEPPGGKQGFIAGNRTNNGGDMPRYYFFLLVSEQIAKERIRGDVAELGVYKGNTAVLLAQLARRTGKTVYLFDTFGGFSEKDLTGIDADKGKNEQFDDTSLDQVRAMVGEQNVRFVQGRFPESISQVPHDAEYSVVHIDCDLYQPFVAALEYFYPRLVSGAFLIMHDYSSRSWNGAEKAVDEFFADKPEWIVPLSDKSGTAIIRKI